MARITNDDSFSEMQIGNDNHNYHNDSDSRSDSHSDRNQNENDNHNEYGAVLSGFIPLSSASEQIQNAYTDTHSHSCTSKTETQYSDSLPSQIQVKDIEKSLMEDVPWKRSVRRILLCEVRPTMSKSESKLDL